MGKGESGSIFNPYSPWCKGCFNSYQTNFVPLKSWLTHWVILDSEDLFPPNINLCRRTIQLSSASTKNIFESSHITTSIPLNWSSLWWSADKIQHTLLYHTIISFWRGLSQLYCYSASSLAFRHLFQYPSVISSIITTLWLPLPRHKIQLQYLIRYTPVVLLKQSGYPLKTQYPNNLLLSIGIKLPFMLSPA